MSKTFILACGGTGGHVSPGIALAQALLERGHRCILLISTKTVDQTLCQAYPNLSTVALPGIGFTHRLSSWPRCGFLLFRNVVQSLRLLRKSSADAVIGFGGFTNVGIILSAFLLRKPCFLHEANQVVGRTIRWLGRWATTVYVPLDAQRTAHLPVKFCPFPLRKEFQKIDKIAAKKQLGCDPQKPLWVVVGGSQGARILTQWAREQAAICTQTRIQLICITGEKDSSLKKSFSEPTSSMVRFVPFSHRMPVLYSAADLVIGRAGAGTIAELTRCETPSILVPLPTSADGHQLANARAFERQGGCCVLEQSRLSELWNVAQALQESSQERQSMERCLQKKSQEDGTQILVQDVENTVGD